MVSFEPIFVLLDLLNHELPLDVLAEIVDRHAFLLQRRLELLLVLEVLFLAKR